MTTVAAALQAIIRGPQQVVGEKHCHRWSVCICYVGANVLLCCQQDAHLSRNSAKNVQGR